MSRMMDEYLDRVMVYANIEPAEEQAVRRELGDHLNEKIDDLIEGGAKTEDAVYEAIKSHGHPAVIGYGLRRWRWIDVRSRGTAKGFIAIGPRAVGFIAIGGQALGIIAIGGLAAGLISMAGIGFGLLFAYCGLGMGGIVYSGFAVGVFACGGFSVGLVSRGGFAAGLLAEGGMRASVYSLKEAPIFLHWIRNRAATSALGTGLLFLTITVFMFACLAVSTVMSRREQKRVAVYNPWQLE